MYPDRGDISAPLDADVSLSKDVQRTPAQAKEVPLLRLRNGALQAGLNERLQRVVAMRKVRGIIFVYLVFFVRLTNKLQVPIYNIYCTSM